MITLKNVSDMRLYNVLYELLRKNNNPDSIRRKIYEQLQLTKLPLEEIFTYDLMNFKKVDYALLLELPNCGLGSIKLLYTILKLPLPGIFSRKKASRLSTHKYMRIKLTRSQISYLIKKFPSEEERSIFFQQLLVDKILKTDSLSVVRESEYDRG